MPETNLAKFKKLLSELFMLDRADLDFGIYRIMNSKREEITRSLAWRNRWRARRASSLSYPRTPERSALPTRFTPKRTISRRPGNSSRPLAAVHINRRQGGW